MNTDPDFYEDDEDPEEVHAAFERAQISYTTQPTWTGPYTWTSAQTITVNRTWRDTHTDTS